MNEILDGVHNNKIWEYRAYVMDTAAMADDRIFQKCLHGVSMYRRAKVERLRKREDKNSSLAAGMLLAYALKEYADIDERTLIYTRDKAGKLFADTGSLNIQFSISHTEGCVAVIIGHDLCGIDVERVRMIPASIVKRMYSERDRDILDSCTEPDIFGTCVWTRREAYGKLTGEGILMNDVKQSRVMDDEYMAELKLKLESYGVFGKIPGKNMRLKLMTETSVPVGDADCTYIVSTCTETAGMQPLCMKMIDSSDIVCYHV